MQHKGYLVLIGGAEDKTREMRILRRTLEINYAKNIVVIPSASGYPADTGKKYYHVFRDLGADNVKIFDIRGKHEADSSEYLKQINYADLIFFTGGDQVKLADTLLGTKLLRKIKRLFKDGITIAGTSAGAAAAGNLMIFDGDRKGFRKGMVKYSEGFEFIKNITIDTHFNKRERLLRLTDFLISGNSSRGIGLGEDTAIIINPFKQFEVIGSGIVTLLDSRRHTYSNYETALNNERLNTNGLNIGFLQDGAVFNMQHWSVNKEATEKEIYSSNYNYSRSN